MSSPLLLDSPNLPSSSYSKEYNELLSRLYNLSKGGTKFGLERIKNLLNVLGHPEQGTTMVHVAGSNGKGSTSAFLASILAAHGLNVGLFTSPHLIDLTERIRFISYLTEEDKIHNTDISHQQLIKLFKKLTSTKPNLDDVSFFEVVTALGLMAFKDAKVDIAVIEAGLGARLDSTRLVDAKVTVLTDLSLEHTAILGDTIEEIAFEEGSVIRPNTPIVMADGPGAAMDVIENLIHQAQATRYKIGDELNIYTSTTENQSYCFELNDGKIDQIRLSLNGPHQARNAILATQAAKLLVPDITHKAIKQGLSQTYWPGRLEVFNKSGLPKILLDGAQNAHAASTLSTSLQSSKFLGNKHFLFGALNDKDIKTMLQHLIGHANSFSLVEVPSPRTTQPAEIKDILINQLSYQGDVYIADSIADGLRHSIAQAQNDNSWVVACGSLYMIGDLRKLLCT